MDKFSVALKTKFKHGQIFSYIVDNNLTVDQMAALLNISTSTLENILHFKWRPKSRKAVIVKKLEDFFHCSINQLFPPELYNSIDANKELSDLFRKTHIRKKEIDLQYLPFYAVPEIAYEENIDERLDKEKLKEMLDNLLTELNPHQRKVLKLRYGINQNEEEYSLDEIAKKIKLSRERVHQILISGIDRLRKGKRIKKLRPFQE